MRIPVLVVGCVTLVCGTLLLASGTLAEAMDASGRHWVGHIAKDLGATTVVCSLVALALEIVGLLSGLTAFVTRLPRRWLEKGSGQATPATA